MSRRKQARPIRHLESEDGTPIGSLPNGEVSSFSAENDATIEDAEGDDTHKSAEERVCRHCHTEFPELPDFYAHKKECDRKAMLLGIGEEPSSGAEEMEEEEEDEESNSVAEEGVKRLEEVQRQRQDAENNNREEGGDVEVDGELQEGEGFPFPAPAVPAPASHVTLEALQNTKVAVAQFAATTMANNGDNAAALQELAVLQSTLFTLQHQQVMQLSLIQQLQSQLSITLPKDDDSLASSPPPVPVTPTIPIPPQSTTPKSSQTPIPVKLEVPVLTPTTQSIPSSHSQQQQQQQQHQQQLQQQQNSSSTTLFKPHISSASSSPPAQTYMNSLQSMCSISSSLADTIITNNDPMPLNEPNTLDMLQKRAQEVLDNASQGLLANNLADELAFRKSGCKSLSPYDSKTGGRNEPFFKHRCRYCGKVFGSDSALQIHIRSHTGERPFKCNVCGSRFTTKGNLKVHFQRHTSKFPHIKMNPNPVPEHLDKYHPPLLAQMGQSLSPGHSPHPHHPHSHHPPPPHPHHPFHSSSSFPQTSIPLYRPPQPQDIMPHHQQPPPLHQLDSGKPMLPGHPMFSPRAEQDMPENLSKPQSSHSSPPPPSEHSDLYKKEPLDDEQHHSDDGGRLSPKHEVDTDHEPDEDHDMEEGCYDPSPYDDCSLDSKYSDEDMLMGEPDSPLMDKNEDSLQEQPENLSSKSTSAVRQSIEQRLPPSFPFPSHAVSPPSSTSSGSANNTPNPGAHIPFNNDLDPSKDPAIYTNLLPRPGSNDNSWESLIEVTKTSETYKLQQLVDNIENKLTDPNQCVICHRVLSCKSALQMHYRTHTGERPFRCKICGRAFTTKGNLKTHMGVHRAKPPMRVLHQCPVCHKKFTNALVLQQHIRLHTGEPTDLTPEQIQAAEIKEYPHSPFSLPNSMNPFLAQGFHIPGMPLPPHGLHLGPEYDDRRDDDREMKDDYRSSDFLEDDSSNDSSSPPMPSFSTSLAALENQVRTITTSVSHLSSSGLSRSAEELCKNRNSSPIPMNGDKSPECMASPAESEIRASPSPPPPASTPLLIPRPPSSQQPDDSPIADGSETNSSHGALDLTPRSAVTAAVQAVVTGPTPGVFSGFGLLPPGSMTSALSALTTSVLTSTSFSPLGMAVGPAARPGNTTCNICFKTFACNSALEIHFRSHTKERPFKCTVCERGFSTKGNSAPLDAQSNRDCICDQWRIQRGDSGGRESQTSTDNNKRHRKRNGNDDSNRHKKQGNGSSSNKKYSTLPPLLCNPGYAAEWNPLLGNMKQHMLTHKIRDMPSHLFENIKPPQPPPIHVETTASNDDNSIPEDVRPPPPPPPPKIESPVMMKMEMGMKRSPPEGESLLPIPKRQPGLPKHLCHVCNKNFSSSSALQIHMRTHTGDKPFRCTVCQKAFTTKGNLKVHMGTHMWSNGASRRGRRMSLDLPPIPMTPKDSEFLQRRPDLFYPYLPAPFLNGMQQKLNEISVIQSVNSNNISGLNHPNSKYASLLGFGGYCVDKPHLPEPHQRSQTNSPLSDKPPSSVSSPPPLSLTHHHGSPPLRERESDISDRDTMPRGMWDLHYDRKPTMTNGDEPMNVSPSPPPGHVTSHPPPTPRGEGLAA